MSQFSDMIAQILELEGELSMDPDDPGNWTGGAKGLGDLKGTKYGISAAAFPSLDIQGLTRAKAIEIYAREYYHNPGIDKLCPALQLTTLDAVIQHGSGSSKAARDGGIRFLQRALKVPDDGEIGPQTVAAAAAVDPLPVAVRALSYRLHFMTYTKTWSKNSRGFARRIAKLMLSLDGVK